MALDYRWMQGIIFALALGFLAACAEESTDEPQARMPDKEHTWVRKETVKKTKEDFFAAKDKAAPQFTIDEELKKRLSTPPAGFERSPEVRPFSSQGIQIDSQTNKMVFAFKHLCDSARGLTKTGLAIVLSHRLKSKSREELKKELIKLGEAEADVDKWLAHQKYYASIASLISKGEVLIGFYDELSKRQVDAATKDAFLTDTATLLLVLNDMLASEKYMALALKEDNAVPNEFLSDM